MYHLRTPKPLNLTAAGFCADLVRSRLMLMVGALMFRGLPGGVRVRLTLETAAAALTAALAILTLFSREWIEALTGTDPDGGSGALEWALVIGFALVSLGCALVVRADLRRAHRRAAAVQPTTV